MTRAAALARAERHFDSGAFLADLARRVAVRTESQVAESRPHLASYLEREMRPALERLGFTVRIKPNPDAAGGPFLVAERIEDPALPTVLSYGHADVIRGQDAQWTAGKGPWTLAREGDRVYGRGTADNKGQHSILLASLAEVLAERGRLGFNARVLLETGEEIGSPGLAAFCAAERASLAADLLLASDGPRLSPGRPTMFMGARGCMNFTLAVRLRQGGHHSGNWGGLLANPGIILANALAAIVDANGRVLVRDLLPKAIPNSVRATLADLAPEPGPDDPAIDPWWGEPGLSAAEKVFGWNTFEVLAFKTGNPDHPVNAVPPEAVAHCHIRFTVDRDWRGFLPALRRHLDARGFERVVIEGPREEVMAATRLDVDHPVARWAAASIARTTGAAPAILPNLGGSLPNEVFSDILGLPTVWVPHSYAGCRQHAPDEHALASILRQGLSIMTGLFWDLGEAPPPRAGIAQARNPASPAGAV
jgi:acetylornithine deacetylase/succinyl-diaminopimelate desuccinylase-like protein